MLQVVFKEITGTRCRRQSVYQPRQPGQCGAAGDWHLFPSL